MTVCCNGAPADPSLKFSDDKLGNGPYTNTLAKLSDSLENSRHTTVGASEKAAETIVPSNLIEELHNCPGTDKVLGHALRLSENCL